MPSLPNAEHSAVATIVTAWLAHDPDGILAVTLAFRLEGDVHVSIGSFDLGANPAPGLPRTNYGAAFLDGLLGACGAFDWAQVQGSEVLLLTAGPLGRPLCLENLPGQPGRRFIFGDLPGASVTGPNAVRQAEELATAAHAGQVDKAGLAYIGHPRRVLGHMVDPSTLEQVVAWLHDVVEDTDITLDEIARMFGAEAAEAVDALTHRAGESNVDYLDRVKATRSR